MRISDWSSDVCSSDLQRSAFLSSFFTLVGTHGLHVTFGIVWLVTLMFQLSKHGLIAANKRRVMCLSMFWHFLDVVRSEEHTSELQSLMRISYAVFCLKKNKNIIKSHQSTNIITDLHTQHIYPN